MKKILIDTDIGDDIDDIFALTYHRVSFHQIPRRTEPLVGACYNGRGVF